MAKLQVAGESSLCVSLIRAFNYIEPLNVRFTKVPKKNEYEVSSDQTAINSNYRLYEGSLTRSAADRGNNKTAYHCSPNRVFVRIMVHYCECAST